MRHRIILLILVAFSLSCKKKAQEEETVDMSYTLSNETILSSTTSPLVADVNNDGTPDYGFSFASVTNSSGTHLYALESSYNGSTAITGPTDNALYSSSGLVSNYKSGDKIDGSLRTGEQWKADFGVLATRHTNGSTITYDGGWANETEQMMAIKLTTNSGNYFGWIRLKYNKTEQKITLVDFAYNRLSGMPVDAGQK